jgi:hypothetical protein
MSTTISRRRSSKVSRFFIGLGAFACILSAVGLGLANGVIKVQRAAHRTDIF